MTNKLTSSLTRRLTYSLSAPLGTTLGQGGAPAWNPSQLGASLLAWWNADRSDLITLSGSQVITWADAVGGYAPTQGTAGSRPIYSATGWNSVAPGVTFDGTDDQLTLVGVPAGIPTGATPSELWVLTDQTLPVSDTATRLPLSIGDGTNKRAINRVVTAGNSQFLAGTTVNSTAPGDFTGRHTLRGQFSATNVTASMDGSAGSATAAVPATATTRLRIGAFTGTSASLFYAGVIREILVTGALSAGNATLLETYLDGRK